MVKMSIDFFPPEILIEIFSYFSFRELVRIERTNIYFRDLIRSITFEDELLGLEKKQIVIRLTKYKLVSIDVSFRDITDMDIEIITTLLNNKGSHVKMLDLRGCYKITDEGLKFLSGCQWLNLTWCDQITDEGLKILTSCQRLNLTGSKKITDEGLKFLSHCQELNLAFCDKITDEGLKSLSHCQKLDLQGCDKITNEYIKELKRKGIKITR